MSDSALHLPEVAGPIERIIRATERLMANTDCLSLTPQPRSVPGQIVQREYKRHDLSGLVFVADADGRPLGTASLLDMSAGGAGFVSSDLNAATGSILRLAFHLSAGLTIQLKGRVVRRVDYRYGVHFLQISKETRDRLERELPLQAQRQATVIALGGQK